MEEEKKTSNAKEEAKKKDDTVKKLPKKLIIIIISIVIALAIIGALIFFATKGKGNDGDGKIALQNRKENAKIVKNETSTIEYEKFDNSLVSFEYPKGWKVEIAPTDYIHYHFKVYNPENPTYMFLFGLKQEGALKSEKARQVYASYYPDAPFAKIAAIDPQTTEAFYKVWNKNAKYNNESLGVEFMPLLNDFKVIENLGKDMAGGDILRASFTDSNGKTAQGLFTAAVKSIGTYYISENIFNPFGPKVDVSPLNTYNIMIMSAPEDDFINWQGILDHCLGTIEFSQTFISGFNQEENQLVSTIQANQRVYDQISDMIMDSWEQRNKSSDILSQKRSDSTLGYERVYDTETGDIYKAYNGFTDDYTGDRYQPITDNMYTEATAGYIEKAD